MHWDAVLTAVIALAAVSQAAISFWQARVYERQYKIMSQALVTSNKSADAALQNIAALEKLERPFLMIEIRGERKNYVWAVNKGKMPAQIIWINPSPIPIYPQLEEKLPDAFNYGYGYYDDSIEVLNVEWIAPGDEKEICSFEPDYLVELPDNIRQELNSGQRVACFLSALKYRGMLNDKVFESRFCFRWAKMSGLRLYGPHGYNQYT